MPVGTDGPLGVYVPVSGADWTTLGLPTPLLQLNCQDASGVLVPNIGDAAITFTVGGTGHLYQQSVTGWTRKFVGNVDGSSLQRWYSGNVALNLAAGESVAVLYYAAIENPTATTRDIYGVADHGTNGNRIRINTDNKLTVVNGNLISKSGAYTYSDLTTVRAFLWYRDATGNRSGLMTNLEHIPTVHYEAAIAQPMTIGASTSGNSANTRTGLWAIWKGADAETIARKATLTTLGWAPSWSETVMTDGPANVYVPQGSADFTALGLPAPDYLWPCQEVSGSLVPGVGSAAVVLDNLSSLGLYNIGVTGWNRRFVSLADLTNQRFTTQSASLNLSSGESYAVVAIMTMNTTGPGNRALLAQGYQNSLYLAGSVLSTFHNNVGVVVPGSYGGANTAAIVVWYRNATDNISGCKTNLGQITATHSEESRTGEYKGFGGASAENSVGLKVGWYAVYKGANAERDWFAYLRTLGWNPGVGGVVNSTLADATLVASASAMSIDGPKPVYIPVYPNDFIALGLPIPDFLWPMQEASGSLVPVIGNPAVVFTNFGGAGYQATVAGWTRKFIITTDGVVQGFGTVSSALDLSYGESYALIAVGSLNSASSYRAITVQGVSNSIRLNLDNTLAVYNKTPSTFNIVNMPGSYDDSSTPHIFVWYRDCVAGLSGCNTDLGSALLPHQQEATAGLQKGIGGDTYEVAPTTRFTWYAVYKGVNAEGRNWLSYLRTLGWNPGTAAAANVNLASLTALSSATADVVGLLTATLANASLVSAATVDVGGLDSTSLANATLLGSATVVIVAESSNILDDAVGAGVAADPIVSVMFAVLREDELSSTGAVDIVASLDGSFPNISISAAAINEVSGQLDAELSDLSSIETGNILDSGLLAQSALDGISLVSSGVVTISGSLSKILGSLEVKATNVGGNLQRSPQVGGGGGAGGFGGWANDLSGSYQ